jgi:hypothetical protein
MKLSLNSNHFKEIALNKGDQPLTISVEKLIPENKPAKNCENAEVHEKCVTFHFFADSEIQIW